MHQRGARIEQNLFKSDDRCCLYAVQLVALNRLNCLTFSSHSVASCREPVSMAPPHVGNGGAKRGMAQSGSASALGASRLLLFLPPKILSKSSLQECFLNTFLIFGGHVGGHLF
jgi:hypothetical protein